MLLSKKYLELYRPDFDVRLEKKILSVFINKAEKEATGVTVFLSHKHNEKEVLENVMVLLKKVGVKVYIDWKDDEMPDETSGETAVRIKNKIEENKKFILLATNAAISSKWCNWELGYGDSKKYPNNIAIMPITENNGGWVGNEYLNIYPVIIIDYEIFKGEYFVENKGSRVKFVDWLKI